MKKLLLLFLLIPSLCFAGPPAAPPATPGGGSGDLVSTNNLSDVANAATALGNLGGMDLTSAQNVSGVKEVQDDTCFSFGNDADFCIDFDTATGELQFTANSASDVYLSLINSGAGNIGLKTDTADGYRFSDNANTSGWAGSGETEGYSNYDKTDNQHETFTGTLWAGQPLVKHSVITFDPKAVYDQELTYRSLPLFKLDASAEPNGITLVEWKIDYVAGDPTTELVADLICDTTPDYNTAAGATVMDVLDTAAGTASATSFDSSTCAVASNVYIHFGADPTDDNVLVTFDVWYYVDGE